MAYLNLLLMSTSHEGLSGILNEFQPNLGNETRMVRINEYTLISGLNADSDWEMLIGYLDAQRFLTVIIYSQESKNSQEIHWPKYQTGADHASRILTQFIRLRVQQQKEELRREKLRQEKLRDERKLKRMKKRTIKRPVR